MARAPASAKSPPVHRCGVGRAYLVAYGALLLDKLKENEQGGLGGSSPIEDLTCHFRGGTLTAELLARSH